MIADIKFIFSRVLFIEESTITVEDSFFSLGGDSLKLIKLLQGLQDKFKVKIDVRFLFKYNTVKNIAKLLDFFLRHPRLCQPKFEITSEAKSFNLSFEQRQIWLAHNVSVNKALYNIPWIIEIKGKLDESRLFLALERITITQPLFKFSVKMNGNSPEEIGRAHV
jgi:acyl carrier protein